MASISEITNYLESLAPLSTQESYDNCGLIVGDPNTSVSGVLISLDCTEDVVEEAISQGCNLIISHHPIVFKGLKQLNGKNYVERTVIKAIKNDIALYAIHTNLDNYQYGVNFEIGSRLGLKNLKVLSPTIKTLLKYVVFCPKEYVQQVSKAMFEAGAGQIGDYSECSFETEGAGYFKPEEKANPFIGEKNKREKVEETKIEMISPLAKKSTVLSAMKAAHPYEEVAYDVYLLENENQFEGAGMIGELEEPIPAPDFLNFVKKEFNCGVIRHTAVVKEKIQRVAFCGGSGSFLIQSAKRNKADIYLTGDLKYHEFFDAEDQIILADIGHFESEQFTPNLIYGILKKNFINFALYLSKVKTNPLNYL